MNWVGVGYITALGIATAFALSLAIIAWGRRDCHGARILSLCSLLIAVLAASSALEPMAATLRGKEFWVDMQDIGYIFLPVAFLLLALEHAGKAQWLTRRHIAWLMLFPAFSLAAVWSNGYHHLVRSNLHPDPAYGLVFLGKTSGPGLGVQFLYSYLLILAGLAVLLRYGRRAPYPYRGQAMLLFFVGLCPAVWPPLYIFRTRFSLPVDFSPIVCALSLALVGIAILRLGLFDIVPVARDRVLESMRDGMLALDNRDWVMDLNQAAAQMLGITREQGIGKPLAAVYPPIWEVLESLPADAPQSRLPFDLESGLEPRHWLLHVSPLLGSHKRQLGRTLLLQDITEDVAIQKKRERLANQMREAQRLESLGILAGGVAHRFNNLLTAIVTHSDLAVMKLPAGAPARENLELLDKAVRQAAELSNQMLAYSGKGHFLLEALDLSCLANEMAPLLSASVTNRVAIRYELMPDLPAIEGDAGQLRQVLLNLVTNAAEAIGTDTGVITIATGVRRLDAAFSGDVASFGTLPPGDYAFLRVSDSGCGMDAQTLSRIYDPFFSTKFTGRGLGLAAVQGIVRGLHGSMLVESQPGAGSSFTALFPCASRLAD